MKCRFQLRDSIKTHFFCFSLFIYFLAKLDFRIKTFSIFRTPLEVFNLNQLLFVEIHESSKLLSDWNVVGGIRFLQNFGAFVHSKCISWSAQKFSFMKSPFNGEALGEKPERVLIHVIIPSKRKIKRLWRRNTETERKKEENCAEWGEKYFNGKLKRKITVLSRKVPRLLELITPIKPLGDWTASKWESSSRRWQKIENFRSLKKNIIVWVLNIQIGSLASDGA